MNCINIVVNNISFSYRFLTKQMPIIDLLRLPCLIMNTWGKNINNMRPKVDLQNREGELGRRVGNLSTGKIYYSNIKSRGSPSTIMQTLCLVNYLGIINRLLLSKIKLLNTKCLCYTFVHFIGNMIRYEFKQIWAI